MLARNQRGMWAETIACTWLIENGYEVFIGLGKTSCDIIALKAGIPTRVEVKAASSYGASTKPWLVVGVRPELFDMLLVVLPDGEVLVNPPHSFVYQAR